MCASSMKRSQRDVREKWLRQLSQGYKNRFKISGEALLEHICCIVTAKATQQYIVTPESGTFDKHRPQSVVHTNVPLQLEFFKISGVEKHTFKQAVAVETD